MSGPEASGSVGSGGSTGSVPESMSGSVPVFGEVSEPESMAGSGSVVGVSGELS